jgi:hypothetical protein
MSHTRQLVLDKQSLSLVEKKQEVILALTAYCKSRLFPKPTHYNLAQTLISNISSLHTETALINALYTNYELVSKSDSKKLAMSLALLLAKFYNIPHSQVRAYQSLLSNPMTILHSENFLKIFPEIAIGQPVSVADPLSSARPISAETLPELLSKMGKMQHTGDECNANIRATNQKNEVTISLSRTFINNSRAVLYVIYDNIKITNPVAKAHKNARPEAAPQIAPAAAYTNTRLTA